MSELIPTITWTDFVKIVKQGRIGELKSCEVTYNSELIFTGIIPHGDMVAKDYLRIQAEYLGNRSNISEGVEPEVLLEKADVLVRVGPD